MMNLWVLKAMSEGILLTREVLCQKWTKFANLVGIPKDERLKLSNGWLGVVQKKEQLEGDEAAW